MTMVLDRVAATLAAEKIGRTQSPTPEGFLRCADVRIARTGPMLYAADEMPQIEPEPGRRMVTIMRDADVLFAADAIASFSGKPVTNDHPSEFVTPTTWKRDAIGVVLNPRRGEGLEADYLIADLLITDQQAIADVQAGKREVSCGYDADREQVRPGLGRQTKVIGNHVALVDRGRCGPACAIQDKETDIMAKRSVWDRLRTAFAAKDADAFEEELNKAKDAADDESEAEKKKREDADEKKETEDAFKRIVGDALAPITARLTAMDAAIAKRVKDDNEEAAEKKKAEDKAAQEVADAAVTDSASLRDTFNDTMARAEILAPGITLPVFDAKAKSKITVDALCGLRVKALQTAFADTARQAHITAVLGGKPADFAAMTCDSAETVFRAASELARVANNSAGSGGGTQTVDLSGGRMTAAKMQKLIEDRRAKKA